MFPFVFANDSDFASEQLQRQFIQNILDLGSQYSTIGTEESSPFVMKCAEIQLQFLMSSDLYERKGLFNILLEILEEDLEVPTTASNIDEAEGDMNSWVRRSNALAIVARILLEPIPGEHTNTIFGKLLELDKYFVGMSGKMTRKVDFLVVVRRALLRFIGVAGKAAVEVQCLIHLSNEENDALMDSLIRLYTSLDKVPSDELRQITIQFGETLCRYECPCSVS